MRLRPGRSTAAFAVLIAAFAVLVALAVGCTDEGDNGGDVSEFCALLVSAADPFTADAGSLESVTDDLRRLRAVAPAEVRPAVDTLLGAFEMVATESDPDDAAELLAAGQESLLAASEELAAYAGANCGIDLSR